MKEFSFDVILQYATEMSIDNTKKVHSAFTNDRHSKTKYCIYCKRPECIPEVFYRICA